MRKSDREAELEASAENMRSALVEARERLSEQDELLRRLTQPPLLYGTVLTHDYNSAVVIVENRLIEVQVPWNISVEPGDPVKLTTETMQIVEAASVAPMGEIAVVRTPDGQTSEVDYHGETRVVYNGRFWDLKQGDRVVLDVSGMVILNNLGKRDQLFSFNGDTHVSWDDIGGLVEAKAELRELIESPVLDRGLYLFYGKSFARGALLYGPPGCGKTMLGKAAATALAGLHSFEARSTGFIYVKGPEILNKYVGESEAAIRGLFARAREHRQTHGYPAVIFLDEADAVLNKRGSGVSSDIDRTIVPMFLTEMDGLEDSGAFVLLATNRSDMLDPAVTRDGRIDRKIKIARPDQASAEDIFRVHLRGVPLCNGFISDDLAELGASEVFSTDRTLYHVFLRGGETLSFTLSQLVNGGMLAGIVDRATTFALRRDKEAGESRGIQADDITSAVDKVFAEIRDLNHIDELQEFVEPVREDVASVQRVLV